MEKNTIHGISGSKRAESPQFGDFVVGQDKFEDLEIRPALIKNLHHLFDRARSRAVRHFVLVEKPQVRYLCGVTLVRKDGRLTPRLELSVGMKQVTRNWGKLMTIQVLTVSRRA